MRTQLQQVAVATDDRVGLTSHRQCEELVIARVPGDADRCCGILVPERQCHQSRQKQVPGLWLAILVKPGSAQK